MYVYFTDVKVSYCADVNNFLLSSREHTCDHEQRCEYFFCYVKISSRMMTHIVFSPSLLVIGWKDNDYLQVNKCPQNICI